MAHDFQDQEEIENFKYFWRRYGRWLFYVLLLLATAYLGWVLYQNHQRSQNNQAAPVFEKFITQMRDQNEGAAKRELLTLQQDYSRTLVATQATLMMAGTAFDNGKYDEAIKHLQWVQGKQKGGLIQVVTAQRLAVAHLQQKKYDEALKALDVKADDAFKPLLLETRGDVLLAQGKKTEAAAAYQEALKQLPEDAPERGMLQLKVDQL